MSSVFTEILKNKNTSSHKQFKYRKQDFNYGINHKKFLDFIADEGIHIVKLKKTEFLC